MGGEKRLTKKTRGRLVDDVEAGYGTLRGVKFCARGSQPCSRADRGSIGRGGGGAEVVAITGASTGASFCGGLACRWVGGLRCGEDNEDIFRLFVPQGWRTKAACR